MFIFTVDNHGCSGDNCSLLMMLLSLLMMIIMMLLLRH